MLLQHMDECGRLVARARVRARVYVAIQVFGARSLTHFHRSLALALIVAYLRVLVCVCWVRQLFTPECVLIRSYTFDSLGFHSHNPWLFASFFWVGTLLLLLYVVLNVISHGCRSTMKTNAYAFEHSHSLTSEWVIWMDKMYRLKLKQLISRRRRQWISRRLFLLSFAKSVSISIRQKMSSKYAHNTHRRTHSQMLIHSKSETGIE